MQRRVKTYGKRGHRIITVSEPHTTISATSTTVTTSASAATTITTKTATTTNKYNHKIDTVNQRHSRTKSNSTISDKSESESEDQNDEDDLSSESVPRSYRQRQTRRGKQYVVTDSPSDDEDQDVEWGEGNIGRNLTKGTITNMSKLDGRQFQTRRVDDLSKNGSSTNQKDASNASRPNQTKSPNLAGQPHRDLDQPAIQKSKADSRRNQKKPEVRSAHSAQQSSERTQTLGQRHARTIILESDSEPSEYSSYSSSESTKLISRNSKATGVARYGRQTATVTRVSLSSSNSNDSPAPIQAAKRAGKDPTGKGKASRGPDRNRRVVSSSASNSEPSIRPSHSNTNSHLKSQSQAQHPSRSQLPPKAKRTPPGDTAVTSRPKQTPPRAPKTPIEPNDRIDLDSGSESESDSELAFLGKSIAAGQRNQQAHVPTPQIKASHLRQARNRRPTPLKSIPRVSLSSAISISSSTLSLESPSTRSQPLPPLPSQPFVAPPLPRQPTHRPKPNTGNLHLSDSKTPARGALSTLEASSSPLTWENTLTPPTARLNQLSLEDHGAPESADSFDRSSLLDTIESLESPATALRKLLRDANQECPIPFTKFLETFRTKEIDTLSPSISASGKGKGRAVQRSSLKYRKIGDATYSEVFALGDIVLKIVPLAVELDDSDDDDDGVVESKHAGTVLDEDDLPFRSPPENVLKEILITRAVGDCSEGFIKLLKTYVVKGKYPRTLIDIWDEYKRDRDSESTRPNKFVENQLYSIIALPHAGVDLESYNFTESSSLSVSTNGGGSKRTVWREAADIFEQVTRALAGAEDKLKFEHRDLHWGQIVVRHVPDPNGTGISNICATIIDLGLARILVDGAVQFSPFEEECFTGRGVLPEFEDISHDDDLEPDYQFDIYRMMRHHNKDEWTSYQSLTNVMWLHYLLQKLLHHKKLRKPARQDKSGTLSQSQNQRPNKKTGEINNVARRSEWDAYQALVRMDARLGNRLQPIIDEMTGRSNNASTTGHNKQKDKRRTTSGINAYTHLDRDDDASTAIASVGDVLALWLTGSL